MKAGVKKITSPFVYNTYMSCFCFNYSVVFPPRLFTLTKQQKHPPSTTVFMSAKLISNPQTGTGGGGKANAHEYWGLSDRCGVCLCCLDPSWCPLWSQRKQERKSSSICCLARSSGLCYLGLCWALLNPFKSLMFMRLKYVREEKPKCFPFCQRLEV